MVIAFIVITILVIIIFGYSHHSPHHIKQLPRHKSYYKIPTWKLK